MCWLHLFMHFILELDGLAFVRSDRGGISHVAHPPFPFCRRKRVAICPLHKNPFRLFTPRVASALMAGNHNNTCHFSHSHRLAVS